MEYIRMFESVQEAQSKLAQITHPTLSAIRGEGIIALNPGVAPGPDYSVPFYIENINNVTFYAQISKNNESAPTLTIETSLDGITWNTLGDTSYSQPLQLMLPSNSRVYLRCNTSTWANTNSTSYYNHINMASNCNVGGNIMSLLYGSNFTGNETGFPTRNENTFVDLFVGASIVNATNLLLPADNLTGSCYLGMFLGCSSLITAPVLPAITLGHSCYAHMFRNCSSLVTAPALPATTMTHHCYNRMFDSCSSLVTAPALPATTLVNHCYYSMFYGCTSLTTAPALPATELTQYCYGTMFSGCTSLTTAPELPATTMVDHCYAYMFYGCTALTTAPILPATTLATYCYYRMFSGCTGITTSPVLPATTLAQSCYSYMFYDCTNLNYIKCLATDISASSCTSDWVNGVAATGIFVKDPSMSGWTTGNVGIPYGWVVTSTGIVLSQGSNIATIIVTNLDTNTGYYTINGGSHIPLSEGTTNIPITQAMNGQTLLVYGEFDGEPIQETLTLSWTDYSPAVTITETDNYVTIASPTADSIQYRLGSSGEYTTYTTPVYIAYDTTIYVIATKTVSGVTYTTNSSQAVTHTITPPSNLTINCVNNNVTISATNAQTIQYRFDPNDSWITYTSPFSISQTVTVYAQAINSDGTITASQECVYSSASLPSDMIFHLDAINNSGRTGTWYDEINNREVTIDSGCDISTPGKAKIVSGSMYAQNYNPFGTGYTGDFTISWTGKMVIPTTETNDKTDALAFVGSTRGVSSGDYGTGRWLFGIQHNNYKYKMFCNDGSGTTIYSTNAEQSGGKVVMTAIRRNGTVYIYKDSTLVASGSFTKALGVTTTPPSLSITGYNSMAHGCEPRNWEFYSLFICNRAISNDELESAITYQKNRYSIN